MSDRTARLPAGPREVTPRQVEVARLVAEGRTNEEIADTLGISHAGAKYHVSELLGRLGLSRREEIRDWYRHHRSTQRRRAVLALPLGAIVATAGVAALAVAAVVLLIALDGRAEESGEIPGLALDNEVEERQSLSEVEAVFQQLEDGGILHVRVIRFIRGGQEVTAGRDGPAYRHPEVWVEDVWQHFDRDGRAESILFLMRDEAGRVLQRGGAPYNDGFEQRFPTIPYAYSAPGWIGAEASSMQATLQADRAEFRRAVSAGDAVEEPGVAGRIEVTRGSEQCGMNPLDDVPDKTHVVRKNEVDPATYFGTRSSCWAVMPDGSEVLLTSDAAEFHAIDASRWDEIEAFVWPGGTPTPAATP